MHGNYSGFVSNGPGGVESIFLYHVLKQLICLRFLMDLVELKACKRWGDKLWELLVSNGPGGVERREKLHL